MPTRSASLLLAAMLAAACGSQPTEAPGESVSSKGDPHVLLSLSDVAMSGGRHGVLQNAFHAGSLRIERKRVGFLRVGGLREMALTDVDLEVRLPDESAGAPADPMEGGSSGAPPAAVQLPPDWKEGLAEVRANGVVIRVLRGSALVSTVRCARLATTSSSHLRLSEGVVIERGGARLGAESALLDVESLSIIVPGHKLIDLTSESAEDGPSVAQLGNS